MKKVKILLIVYGLLISSVMFGQRVRVFETHKDSIPYRIPALAVCRDGFPSRSLQMEGRSRL